MIKSLKDLLDKFSRFTNSLVYDGGICKRLTNFKFNIKDKDLQKGSRNTTLFNTALKFAFSQENSSIEDIYTFINNITQLSHIKPNCFLV